MKVSLIIPVYNVEAFLPRCLNSVEEQTYGNLEVIIVNDGSTDGSRDIIESYVAKNSTFKVFDIENRGLGGARNYGLDNATGDYVVFLDSDDYIAADCIEKFVSAAEKENGDIIICNSCDVTEDGRMISAYRNLCEEKATSLIKQPQILFNRFSAWGKMYRRDLFQKYRFVSREWYEDLRCVVKLYAEAEKIVYLEDELFFYVQRQGSIMNNSNAKRNLEIITAFEDVIGYYKEKGMYEAFEQEFQFMVIEHILVAAMSRVAMTKTSDRKAILAELKAYALKFENIHNNKYISRLGLSKRLILFFNKHGLYFCTALCLRMKKRLG